MGTWGCKAVTSSGEGTASGGPCGQGHNDACHQGWVGRRGHWGSRGGPPALSLLDPDSQALLSGTHSLHAPRVAIPHVTMAHGVRRGSLGVLPLRENKSLPEMHQPQEPATPPSPELPLWPLPMAQAGLSLPHPPADCGQPGKAQGLDL